MRYFTIHFEQAACGQVEKLQSPRFFAVSSLKSCRTNMASFLQNKAFLCFVCCRQSRFSRPLVNTLKILIRVNNFTYVVATLVVYCSVFRRKDDWHCMLFGNELCVMAFAKMVDRGLSNLGVLSNGSRRAKALNSDDCESVCKQT